MCQPRRFLRRYAPYIFWQFTKEGQEGSCSCRVCQPIGFITWWCRHCRCRVAGIPDGARGGSEWCGGAVSAVRGAAGGAGGGAAAPGGALPARQPAVPGGVVRASLRAPQLGAQPHAHQASPPVGRDENSQVELWVGRLEPAPIGRH